MSCGIDQDPTRHRVVINYRRRGVVSFPFNFLVMLGRTKRRSPDLSPESHKQGTNAHASLSLMLLSVASQTLGWSRPQLEPGHAIRVTVVSSDPLQIGPCVVLGSGAWHLEFLPITTHCRCTAYETPQPQRPSVC